MITLSPQDVRRLAVAAQRLEAPAARPTRADILDTIRQITCVQIDPINVVARTQLLVPYSRLGAYDPAELESLLWEDKALFEYWAHAASIVLTDDYPLFQYQMRNRKRSNGAWAQRYYEWLEANHSFRQFILDELEQRGPLFADEIEDRAELDWPHQGWGHGNHIIMMLEHLWVHGQVTVTGRDGNGYGLKKQWGLMAHQLPQWQAHEPLPAREVVRRAVERALPALGVGRLRDIRNYFTRNHYPGLAGVLAELEAEERIQQVTVRGDNGDWPDSWYIHRDTLPLLERLQAGEWRPQTVLLSPFDNLIADRDRTELLFDFFYRVEIYVPAAKRQYGYYTMPVLHGDRLIGRIDPKMDRRNSRLIVNAIHLEPDVKSNAATRRAIKGAIERLATFLGAAEINYPADES
jgi:uncharacterized protein